MKTFYEQSVTCSNFFKVRHVMKWKGGRLSEKKKKRVWFLTSNSIRGDKHTHKQERFYEKTVCIVGVVWVKHVSWGVQNFFFFNLQLASFKKNNHKDSTEHRMSDMSIVKLKRVCYIFSITLIVQVHSSALVYWSKNWIVLVG